MEDYLTPKQVAHAVGVSEASIKRWCDKGLIRTRRTGGGHRRLHRTDVLAYLRRGGIPLAKPELLGLAATTNSKHLNDTQVLEDLESALLEGKRERVRRLLLDLYMRGQGLAAIGDEFISRVFERLGKRWQHREIFIFEERRACDIIVAAVRELEALLPEVEQPLLTAACATFRGDHYDLPITLVSAVLKESECHVEKLGNDLPEYDLESALEKLSPDVFCLSISHIQSPQTFVRDLEKLQEKARELDCTLITGGRAFSPDLRREHCVDLFVEDLAQLDTFLQAMKRTRKHTRDFDG